MSRERRSGLLILLGGIVLSVLLGGTSFAGHNGCGDCHVRGTGLKTKKVNDLCLSCHPENIKDHVLDVVSKSAPRGLPLDVENRITCITCHDAHDRAGRQDMLRMDASQLCVPCHPDAKGAL